MLINPKEVHPEAWTGGGQRAHSGDRRYEATGNGYPGATATGYCEPGGQAGISSRRFVAASVPDLKRLDVRSPTGAVGTVDRVIWLADRSIMSRSLVEATVPGLKQPESPSTKGTEGWLRTLCIPTRHG